MSPFVIVIFGATGELARTKLMPALFSLFKQGQLGSKFYIIGFARRSLSDSDFRNFIKESKNVYQEKDWETFSKNIYYQQGVFEEPSGYEQLIEKLNTFDKEIGACISRLFYLATPPDNYETILNFLQTTKLSEGCGQGSSKWTKLIIEKPFGKNLETAKKLDEKLAEIFEERQIFRVDHYLGKETVQNMIAFRFANGIFEPVWNKNYIDHVQVTWAESQGVSGHGKFFDGVGILRDVAQNHLLQLLTTVTMEQPKTFSKEGVRDARAEAIKKIKCIEPSDVSNNVVRGQYEGYQDEKNVVKGSNTETFVAMKLFVDNERFSGVPFYIRAGKKMPKDSVSISIVFIQTCHLLFKEFGCPEEGNVLTIRIQPDEGINLRVIAKKPFDLSQGSSFDLASGRPGLALTSVNMGFSYQNEFGGKGADAYEKLLLDIFAGDQMLFNRSDELHNSWEFITKILEGWREEKNKELGIKNYEPGSWGPKEADDLIEKDGRKWIG